MSNPWICEICAKDFDNEVDLLAHQFNSSCEKEIEIRYNMTDAYREGIDAFERGDYFDMNPFDERDAQHYEWEDGYTYADILESGDR